MTAVELVDPAGHAYLHEYQVQSKEHKVMHDVGIQTGDSILARTLRNSLPCRVLFPGQAWPRTGPLGIEYRMRFQEDCTFQLGTAVGGPGGGTGKTGMM